MINKVWASLISIGIIYAFFTNRLDIINNTILESSKISLDMLLKIIPVLALWMGLTKIAEDSGLLKKISSKISFIIKKLFKEIPEGHESLGYISSNIVANIFGLGSAATPFGIKAIQSMQKLNNKKDTATNSMITFLVINTCGLTLIPTTIISLRLLYNSNNPSSIVLPCLVSTTLSTIFGLIINSIFKRRYKD